MTQTEELVREDLRQFDHFSREYAQALDAFAAIERQAATILLLGSGTEVGQFVDQFIEMATRFAAEAKDQELDHFYEWFIELVEKAEALKTQSVAD
jgi:hypothetical protein